MSTMINRTGSNMQSDSPALTHFVNDGVNKISQSNHMNDKMKKSMRSKQRQEGSQDIMLFISEDEDVRSETENDQEINND